MSHYNLAMIIAVGYRVKSQVATRFRQWATIRLQEFIQKGFTLDDDRLKGKGNRYFRELLQRIRDIRSSERNLIEKLKVELLDPGLVALADKIVQVIEEGKQALAISINEIIKTTYWRIGQYIVEFEQQGNAKAKYGTSLLSNLAKLLRARVGRGYSHPNLNNMRKFYLMYPNFQISDKSSPIFQTSEKSDSTCQTVSDKLTWSHICELVTIDDQLEREFYEKECISEGWTVNELHRQKESGLFMRLAVSKDKQGVLTQYSLPYRPGVLSPHIKMLCLDRLKAWSR